MAGGGDGRVRQGRQVNAVLLAWMRFWTLVIVAGMCDFQGVVPLGVNVHALSLVTRTDNTPDFVCANPFFLKRLAVMDS